MTKRSTMFLNNVTAIDFAFIDDTGWVQGGSLNPTFLITGKVDPVENVVIDFSTVKKLIKEVIDGKENGYDHKLWILPGYSLYEELTLNDNNVVVSTDKVVIDSPRNAFKIFERKKAHIYGLNYMAAEEISSEIAKELNDVYPGFDIEVEMRLEPTLINASFTNTHAFPFRYVHGLKNSTSWGCQNIAHGHFSFISAFTANRYKTNFLLSKIANYLDNSIFVWKENSTETTDEVIVSYSTERGNFRMSIKKSISNKVLFMNEETTVENIVEEVAEYFKEELFMADVIDFYVSEGLNKGAVKTLS